MKTDINQDVSCHVETVCLLVLRNPVTHINIDVDVDEMVRDKRSLATYGKTKDYVLEHQQPVYRSGKKETAITEIFQHFGMI